LQRQAPRGRVKISQATAKTRKNAGQGLRRRPLRSALSKWPRTIARRMRDRGTPARPRGPPPIGRRRPQTAHARRPRRLAHRRRAPQAAAATHRRARRAAINHLDRARRLSSQRDQTTADRRPRLRPPGRKHRAAARGPAEAIHARRRRLAARLASAALPTAAASDLPRVRIGRVRALAIPAVDGLPMPAPGLQRRLRLLLPQPSQPSQRRSRFHRRSRCVTSRS